MKENLVIVTGHYGSGKTVFAVNLAIAQKKAGKPTAIADLDIVNPYFCSREQKNVMEALGIRVVLPAYGGGIDLPAISAEVHTLLEDETLYSIFDMGGDPIGARVLACFAPYLKKRAFELLCVVNANRPETATVQQALAYIRMIEESAKQKMTGLINNTHMLHETSEADFNKGYALTAALSAQTGIPVKYHMITRNLYEPIRDRLAGERDAVILPIDRTMNRPWE